MLDGDSDFEDNYEGLKLKSSSEVPRNENNVPFPVADFDPNATIDMREEDAEGSEDSEEPVRYESTFTSSFLPKMFANLPTMKVGENSEEEPKESSLKADELNFNTKDIYATISSSETNRDSEMCVLHLLECVSNIDHAGQQMIDNLQKYGKFIQSQKQEDLRKLGYMYEFNHDTLVKSLRSLKSTFRLLSLEATELEEIAEENVNPGSRFSSLFYSQKESERSWTSTFTNALTVGLTTASVFIAANELRKHFYTR